MLPTWVMGRASRGWTGWIGVAMAALIGAGCGPIEYVGQVTRKASSAVEAARAAEADRYSPYYFTLAVEYLHKAREEAAAADFQAATRFGKRSQEAAEKARLEAIDIAGKPIEQFYPGFRPPGSPEKDAGSMAPLDDKAGDGEMAPLDDGADEVPADLGKKKKK